MNEQREKELLGAIGSEEASSYNEFLNGLDAVPSDRDEWAEMFSELRQLQTDGQIIVERSNGKIDSLQLSDSGVARFKQLNGR